MTMKSAQASNVLKVSRLIKTLNALTVPKSPGASAPKPTDESSLLIDSVLQENLQALVDEIQSSAQLQEDLGDFSGLILQNPYLSFVEQREVSVREKYVEVCIYLLHQIKASLCSLSNSSDQDCSCSQSSVTSAPKPDPDALSAPQVKTLSSSLQFVVVLAISPYLAPGVGIPVSQRLGPGQILLATPCDYGAELTHRARIQRLLAPVRLLSDLLAVRSLRDIVIDHHLQDLLPALYQLRFSTKSLQDQIARHGGIGSGPTRPSARVVPTDAKPASGPVSEGGCASDNGCDKEQDPSHVFEEKSLPEAYLHSEGRPWTLPLVREHCNHYIDKAVRFSSTQHVLKTLMMLSGGGKSSGLSMPVKTPAWYRRCVAALLRDVLMVPNGVQHLIALLVAESPGGHDWQKCKAVAQVIAQLPTTPANLEQFHKSVTNQVMALIQSGSDTTPAVIIRAVGAIILELTNRQPTLMESVCFAPLFDPLLRISSSNEALSSCEGDVVVPEPVLFSCVCCLHRLYVIGQEPQSPLLNGLSRVVGVLFSMFLVARSSVSLLKSKCRDLLAAYINHCSPSEAVSCLLTLVASVEGPGQVTYPSLHRDVRLTMSQSGGLQALRRCQADSEDTSIDSWTQPVDAMMDILTSVKTDDIIPQLFICLLQKLTTIVKSESAGTITPSGDIILPARLLSSAQRTSRLAELREKVCLVSLLAAVGDKYGEGVVSSGRHVLEFAKATLERCVQICQTCSDETTMAFEWETVSMAMGLLTAVLGGGVEVGDQSGLLDELLPLLTYISDCEVADARVREMADDLKVAVATKGLVWAELSKMKSSAHRKEKKTRQDSRDTPSEGKKKNLIEVLSETSIEDDVKSSTREQAVHEKDAGKSNSPLEQALQELCDPMLPVRGHGLIALARLVEERSPEVGDRKAVLLKVFLENLTHTDSYIYLASVNGLAALSDLFPDQVMSRLTSELRAKCVGTAGASEDGGAVKPSGDLVLKLGEAVVKATRRLGEMIPKYRDMLLSSILCGCRHDDPLTRASCLSGLAEVCQLLRFALGPVLHEVVTCCRDVISSDPAAQPREAAALTFTLILRGLGRDTLLALGDVLSEMYRTLKRAATHDPGEGVRTNAALALEELDSIMREALFTRPELAKRITILGHQ